ncbi:hypothetical protein CTP10_R35510 [Cupriavidus sp. P-10]|uniref:hypothetical protein n=1 Tax=Cupriavidus sp. P-10 TaxID=2027911 RepID=UPI000E2F2B31|nr:hypothetical protein [Cupriavidus sp. P-10]BDB26156.1 hypothetical protein CTP10_R35510 [Cupriavidus sp. P-10]
MEVQSWTDARLSGAKKFAVETVRFAHGGIADCNQVAMFDPEFGQWHFLPMPSQPDEGGEPHGRTT